MKNEFPQPQLKVYTNSSPIENRAVRQEAVRLLMVTDFSQSAEHAESRAAMLSMELDYQPLEIMAIIGSDALPDAGPRKLLEVGDAEQENVGDIECGLRDVATRLDKWEKLAYICSIRFGNPVAGIVDRAEEMDAFITVIGSYGGSIAANLTRGYSTIDVARATTRPILVVKQEPAQSYKKVLVASDFSEASTQAALTAVRVAPEAEFEFLHVVEDARLVTISSEVESNESRLERRIEDERIARSRLVNLIEELGMDAERVSVVVRHGFPSSVIHARSKEIDADLVACGKQACSDAYNPSLGSVAMGLLVQSPCDVLMACSPGDGLRGFDKPAA